MPLASTTLLNAFSLLPVTQSPLLPVCLHPSRSEEHTSELQSRSDLVCRLLLEKKKTSAHTVRPGGGPVDGIPGGLAVPLVRASSRVGPTAESRTGIRGPAYVGLGTTRPSLSPR